MESILIEESNFDKARKQIKENLGKIIIFSSEDDELNRKILEKEKINVLLLNQEKRKDFQKQRNSGFNQVLAKIAKKNNITVGINLDELIKAEGKKKSEVIARVRQNIKICNKNRVKMKFIGKTCKRSLQDIQALALVLGMPTRMIKEL
jgi:RNase P/RNase MRP subunit p30